MELTLRISRSNSIALPTDNASPAANSPPATNMPLPMACMAAFAARRCLLDVLTERLGLSGGGAYLRLVLRDGGGQPDSDSAVDGADGRPLDSPSPGCNPSPA